MDVFIEDLVRKKNTTKTYLLYTGIILATIILLVVLLSLSVLIRSLSFIFLLLAAGVIYGAWFLIGTLRVEFEYIVTNGEMDVDKIMAQRKRKRLVTVKLKDIEVLAPVHGDHKHEFEKSVPLTIDASLDVNDKTAFFLIVNHPKKGMMKLIFTPNHKVIDSAKIFAPRKVFTE